MKKLVAIAAISAVTAFGGTVSAADDGDSNYPPTTMRGGGAGGGGTGGGGELPATGTESTDYLQIAGGVLLAGVALTGVALYRRRATAA